MSESSPDTAFGPDIGDTYRADENTPVSAGYYQVVGRDEDTVTLLRIGDAEGRRRHTGRIESVDRADLPAFETAEAPGVGTKGVFEALWLSLLMVPRNLDDRPVQLLLGVALLAGAAVAPAFLSAPPVVFEAASLLGALVVGAAAAGLPR